MTEDEKREIPNYLAYGVMLLGLLPLVLLEFDPGMEYETFYMRLRDYFAFFLLFEVVLFGFVFAKSISRYDFFHKSHVAPMMFLNLILGFSLVVLIISWMGYFNGGLFVLEWLNK